MFLGDFPEDFATVVCMFTTHATDGSPVAPSTSLEAADVLIYKNGNAAQKATTNGVTMTSPFDSLTGLHCLTIDTSNDTGDGGFWVAGAAYTLVLSPDETVDSFTVRKVIGQFSLGMAHRVGSIATGAITADAVATDAVTEIQNGLATSAALAAIDGKVDTVDTVVDAIKLKTDNLPSDPADASVIAGRFDTLDANLVTVDGVADAIKAKTDNLPSDPADQSLIILATDAIMTAVADVPTNAELAVALAGSDDAVLAALSGVGVQVSEVWKIHGLDIASPMTVTPSSRAAGSIAQTISGDGEASSTVTRTA
jgi:hypothetical protein